MVCGRLPFGDDNQIKKTQARVLYFNRNISSGEYLTHIYVLIADHKHTRVHTHIHKSRHFLGEFQGPSDELMCVFSDKLII